MKIPLHGHCASRLCCCPGCALTPVNAWPWIWVFMWARAEGEMDEVRLGRGPEGDEGMGPEGEAMAN